VTDARTSGRPIHPLFLQRWSPRAFDGGSITHDELMTLLEAARWAPSAFNQQPWRYIYAGREEAAWIGLLNTLIPFNRAWAASASAIIFALSIRETRASDGSVVQSYSHSFDAGAAWAFLALQATDMGLHTHAMTGFDVDALTRIMNVPATLRIEAAIAVGRRSDPMALAEALRARETPSARRPMTESSFPGTFPPEDTE
jgi:nitroreductase